MTGPYDDIINHPHHTSSRHPRMPRIDRASQFAPFAALTGYEETIKETERITEEMRLLTDGEREEIGRKLRDAMVTGRKASLTYFVLDRLKEGGKYKTVTSVIKAVKGDCIIIEGERIKLNYILNITPLSD